MEFDEDLRDRRIEINLHKHFLIYLNSRKFYLLITNSKKNSGKLLIIIMLFVLSKCTLDNIHEYNNDFYVSPSTSLKGVTRERFRGVESFYCCFSRRCDGARDMMMETLEAYYQHSLPSMGFHHLLRILLGRDHPVDFLKNSKENSKLCASSTLSKNFHSSLKFKILSLSIEKLFSGRGLVIMSASFSELEIHLTITFPSLTHDLI